jgi:hypothetical protein
MYARPIEHQASFAFSREERLLMIAAAEFGQTRPTTRRLRALLENLELVSGSKGCFPSIDLLAGRMGTTHRTIQRILAHAAQLGLVASTGRIIPGYGQVENLYHVQWDRLRTYVPADEIARIDHRLGRQSSAKPAANDAGQTGGNLSPGPQKCHRPPRPRVTGPPDTLSPRLSNASNDRAAAERRQLVDLIFSTGVNCADEAVAVALAAGCQLVEIEAAVNWYREHAHEFDGGPGVLYVQIMRMRPGQAVDRGWPKSRRKTKPAAAGVSKQALAVQIIQQGKRAGKPEPQIVAELAAAGLTWGDQDH